MVVVVNGEGAVTIFEVAAPLFGTTVLNGLIPTLLPPTFEETNETVSADFSADPKPETVAEPPKAVIGLDPASLDVMALPNKFDGFDCNGFAGVDVAPVGGITKVILFDADGEENIDDVGGGLATAGGDLNSIASVCSLNKCNPD